MKKRFELQDEPILEPGLAIIDAHHHLFDRPAARYLLDDILTDCALGHDIRATVYIESQFAFDPDGPAHLRPVGETRFANAIAENCAASQAPVQVNAAIVGYADMTDPQVEETLDAHIAAGRGRFRGIRQVAMHDADPAYRALMFAPPPEGLLDHPDFARGMGALARRGLSFDTAILHPQMSALARLADRCPDTVIVLNHLGFAYGMGRPEDVFGAWRDGLADLALRHNVVAKIGGFGMPFWGFGFDRAAGPADSTALAQVWRPYVETA
ncbi:MAG: amidohydrolase family protein, partial [Pseudomonadota bacterium]|nr:amidohydrolase family protein [Pseudomonadota bacterium]